MPRVGDKHYPYTAKGQAAAKAAAKRKGVKVSHGKGYKEGGSVSKSRVNLGNGAPKRKKRAVKKMNAGGTVRGNWPSWDLSPPSGPPPPWEKHRKEAKAPAKPKKKKRVLPKKRGK